MNLKTANELDEILKGNKIVLVDFFATWCGPCKMLSPVIETMEQKMSEIKFVKVNVEEFEGLATKYEVQGVPTVLIFKNGKEQERSSGFVPEEVLTQKLNKY